MDDASVESDEDNDTCKDMSEDDDDDDEKDIGETATGRISVFLKSSLPHSTPCPNKLGYCKYFLGAVTPL